MSSLQLLRQDIPTKLSAVCKLSLESLRTNLDQAGRDVNECEGVEKGHESVCVLSCVCASFSKLSAHQAALIPLAQAGVMALMLEVTAGSSRARFDACAHACTEHYSERGRGDGGSTANVAVETTVSNRTGGTVDQRSSSQRLSVAPPLTTCVMIIEGACECLGYLAAHTDAMRQQLVDQYAVETLVGLLGSQSADSSLLKSRLQLTAGPPVEQSIRRGDGEGENSGSEGQEGDGEEEMKKEMKKRRKEEEKDVNNHAAAVDRLIAATARTVAELTKGHEGRQRLWRGEGKKLGEEMYDGVIQLVQVSQRYTELCFGSGRPSQEEVKGV